MPDVKRTLDRGLSGFVPSPGAFDATMRRIDRRRRNRRIGSATLAIIIAIAAFGFVLHTFRSEPSPAGPVQVVWWHSFGTPSFDAVRATATDGTTVYVAGVANHPSDRRDDESFLRAYGADGQLLWETRFGLSATQQVWIQDIASDGAAIYMTGDKQRWAANATDARSEGTWLWSVSLLGRVRWERPLHGLEPTALAAYAGNVYVVGSAVGRSSGSHGDAVVRRYDADGNLSWSRTFGTHYFDSIGSVAVGPSGVYVTGTLGYWQPCSSPRATGCSIHENRPGTSFLRAYDLSGRQILNVDRVGGELALTSDSVYLEFTRQQAVLVRRLDLGGQTLWTRRVSDRGEEVGFVIAADDRGVFVAGDRAVVRLSTDGHQVGSADVPGDWIPWWNRGGASAYRGGIVVGGATGYGHHADALIARFGSPQ